MAVSLEPPTWTMHARQRRNERGLGPWVAPVLRLPARLGNDLHRRPFGIDRFSRSGGRRALKDVWVSGSAVLIIDQDTVITCWELQVSQLADVIVWLTFGVWLGGGE